MRTVYYALRRFTRRLAAVSSKLEGRSSRRELALPKRETRTSPTRFIEAERRWKPPAGNAQGAVVGGGGGAICDSATMRGGVTAVSIVHTSIGPVVSSLSAP